MGLRIRMYAAIFSHADEPEEGLLAHVYARSAGSAQDECNTARQEPGGLFEGYDFTLWPHPVD